MLGLKSFQTAAVTFTGIELAHRIRKRQFAVTYERNGTATSLKELWNQALAHNDSPDLSARPHRPLMHQIWCLARHRATRQLLASGIDPICWREALRQISANPSDEHANEPYLLMTVSPWR